MSLQYVNQKRQAIKPAFPFVYYPLLPLGLGVGEGTGVGVGVGGGFGISAALNLGSISSRIAS